MLQVPYNVTDSDMYVKQNKTDVKFIKTLTAFLHQGLEKKQSLTIFVKCEERHLTFVNVKFMSFGVMKKFIRCYTTISDVFIHVEIAWKSL